ncbi:Uncharacterised protein [Starkeya nomas]|uniref:Uncharacterized protein n=1 Tax=Starkeya nomas TaxID=2666134 RepID=A0A5S9NYJ7_9HYPH|nr:MULTISPECIES: hypothetical protein [Xanthobacteraceae]CAA0095911.1 Uncharacterised protein [Starkeya nomas]
MISTRHVANENAVIPGLDPGIHAVPPMRPVQGMDGRAKPGHDVALAEGVPS